jgi:hypothetical protein
MSRIDHNQIFDTDGNLVAEEIIHVADTPVNAIEELRELVNRVGPEAVTAALENLLRKEES